jgi:hypothetical protein
MEPLLVFFSVLNLMPMWAFMVARRAPSQAASQNPTRESGAVGTMGGDACVALVEHVDSFHRCTGLH